MKHRLILSTLALGLATGYGVGQDPKQQAELDALQKKVTTLEVRLDSVEGYLQAQAKAEKAMVKVIDDAVSKGYIAGLNYPAREALVKGWKAQAKAAEKGLPGAKKKAPTGRVDPRLARRRER